MDRVSILPDDLLCHILSFLPTKHAASTSVLSKRWRNLWTPVSDLQIDDSVLLHPEEDKRERPEIIQSFMEFVDRVLALQGNSPIKKVFLKCVTEVDKDRVDGWINNVLARGVSDLDICIFLGDDIDDRYWLSPKCFESKNLVKLKIDGLMNIGWKAGCIFLPMLKTLVLDAARVYYKFDILLHALPVLEELVLDDVIWEEDDVSVSSASLKRLTVKGTDCLSTLSFDTPSLVYFKYVGYLASDYPVVNMINLIDAQIIFSLTENELKRVREPDGDWLENDWLDDDALAHSNVWKLFHGLQNVPYLDLFPDTLEVLSLCCESMPVFNNLKYLAIQSAEDRGWQAMPVLLRNCPNLETLVLEGLVHYETDKCGDACDCISQEDKGRSLKSCPIKMLEIQGFRGTMKEMNMIKHFLDYFPCLKEMEIYVAEDGSTQLANPEISKLILELIKLYNKSSSCNVQLLVSDYLYKKWTSEL